MNSQLKQYAADHRFLLDTVARQVGFEMPVAVDMDEFYAPLVKAARRGALLPIDGVSDPRLGSRQSPFHAGLADRHAHLRH